MRRMSLMLLAGLAGCFAEPSSGSSSGGSTSTATTMAGSSGIDTTTGLESSSSFGDSTTTGFHGSSTTFFGSSTGTTGNDTDQPPGTFCQRPENETAIRCTDFDADSEVPWEELEPVGFSRRIELNPPAFSAPGFVRLARNDDAVAGNLAREALFDAAEVETDQNAGLRLHMALRLPPDFDAACDPTGMEARPIRVFAAEYPGSNGAVRLIGSAAPEGIALVYFPPNGPVQQLGPFDVLGDDGAGWSQLEVALFIGPAVAAAAVNVSGTSDDSGLQPLAGFEPPDGALEVNVGPLVQATAMDVPAGCGYDLDDIVLLPIPLE